MAKKRIYKVSIKFLGDTKLDCVMLHNNNDNEGNAMIINSLGLGQDM